MMTNEELLTTLPAYVAGTISPEKKRALEKHLDEHPNLRHYLASLNIHVASYEQQLSEQSTAADDSLYRSKSGNQRERATPASSSASTSEIVKLLPLAEHQAQPKRPLLSNSGWKYAAFASMIAFLIVSFAASYFLLTVRQLSNELGTTQRQLSAQELQSGTQTPDGQIASRAVPISRMGSTTEHALPMAAPQESPGQHRLELLPTADPVGGHAYFLVENERSLLVLDGLDVPADGQVYQLWFMESSGDITFVAPLPLAENGATLIDIYLPMPIYDYTTIGISSVGLAEITQVGTPFFQVVPAPPPAPTSMRQ